MGVCATEEKEPKRPKYDISLEFKTYVMSAQAKINIYRQRKVNAIQQRRKELANLLRANNIEVAKAKMETIMRDEDIIAAYDILSPIFEILKEKVTYILSSTSCPNDMHPQIDTLIYAAHRLEVEEMIKLKEVIRSKYGDSYIIQAYQNDFGKVNENIISKLLVKPYPEALILVRLKQFAKEINIPLNIPLEMNEENYNNNYNNNNNNNDGNNPFNNPSVNNNPYDTMNNNPYDNVNNNPNPYDDIQMNNNNPTQNNPYENPSSNNNYTNNFNNEPNPFGNFDSNQQNNNNNDIGGFGNFDSFKNQPDEDRDRDRDRFLENNDEYPNPYNNNPPSNSNNMETNPYDNQKNSPFDNQDDLGFP